MSTLRERFIARLPRGKPAQILGCNAIIRPAGQSQEILEFLCQKIEVLRQSTLLDGMLLLAATPSREGISKEEKRKEAIARKLRRACKAKRGWSKKIKNLSEGTGLFAMLIADALKDYEAHVIPEPEIDVSGSPIPFDYAIGKYSSSANTYEIWILAEVKRIASTKNLAKYVEETLSKFENLLKAEPPLTCQHTALHFHLLGEIAEAPYIEDALKSLEGASTLLPTPFKVITTKGNSYKEFAEELRNHLEGILKPKRSP